MKNFHLFLITCLFITPAFSQAVRSPVAARYTGLGAYSKGHVDVFSFTQNSAALAQLTNSAAGVYGERRFLLAATNMYSMVAAVPTSKGNFGITTDYFGFKNFNEFQIGLAYARSLGNTMDVGIKFNYYSFRIPAYGNSSALNFEIGVVAHLTEKLHAGFHSYNPAGGKFSKTDDKLSSVYKFGVGYEASEEFLISAEVVKVEDEPVNVHAGMQYNFAKRFFIRAGTSTETANSYIGAGISYTNFRIDVTAGYHPQLGFTPGLMFLVNF